VVGPWSSLESPAAARIGCQDWLPHVASTPDETGMALTGTVNCVLFTKVAKTGTLSKNTIESAVKPDPLIVSVNGGSPAVAELGTRLLIASAPSAGQRSIVKALLAVDVANLGRGAATLNVVMVLVGPREAKTTIVARPGELPAGLAIYPTVTGTSADSRTAGSAAVTS
jgi:hypothetical protein